MTDITCYERMTDRAKRVLELSLREALQLGHNYVGPEHFLMGLLREDENIAAAVLKDSGLKLNSVRVDILNRMNPTPPRVGPFVTTREQLEKVWGDVLSDPLRRKRVLGDAWVFDDTPKNPVDSDTQKARLRITALQLALDVWKHVDDGDEMGATQIAARFYKFLTGELDAE